MKAIFRNLFFLLLAIGLLVGGAVLCVEIMVLGIFLVIAGIMLLFYSITELVAAGRELKELMAAEKASGTETTQRKVTKAWVIGGVCLTVVVGLAVFIYGLSQGNQMNYAAQRLLEREDRDLLESIAEFEEEHKYDWLAKLFFTYEDEFDEVRNAHDNELRERARMLNERIPQLALPNRIESDGHYSKLFSAGNELRNLAAEDEAALRALVPDYDKIGQYMDALKQLRSTYQVTCNNCKGNGGFTCQSCHGSGKQTCSSCGGRGKTLVTWYSEGDWGETSYTSSTCGGCGGSGKRSCSQCSGGKHDCNLCDGGYNYIYENDR